MTETDKIEISYLLTSMREMQNYAKETNLPYFDNGIAEYAKCAKLDYVDNKAQLIKILSGNLPLFLGDLKNLKICINQSGYGVGRGESFQFKIGQDLWITARLTDFTINKEDCYNFYANVRDMEISDIRFRTSDTSDERYSICCWENLVDHYDDFNATPLTFKRNAKEWNCLLNRASRTREMNKLLVRCFKELMKERVALFREKANANEKTKCELKNTTITYMKVDL